MATRNFPVSGDSTTIQEDPATNENAANLFVGRVSISSMSFTTRAFLQFSLDWTGVSSITSAVLHIRTGGGWIGAGPGVIFRRNTSTWTETGITWNNQPSTTATDAVTSGPTNFNAFNTWYAVTITDIVKAWAPASIPGGGAQTNYGIRLASTNEASLAVGTNFERRESAYDAYIVLTYGSNTAPNAPLLNSPVGLTVVASQTPVLTFTPSDAEGDTHTAYTYQVDDNDTFPSPDDNYEVAGSFANGTPVNRTVVASLTRGGTYAWRVKTKDATLYGPYQTGYFKIGRLPTTVVTVPAAGHTAGLWYTAGTSTTPKIRVGWSFSCADGHAQTHYRAFIYADSAGSPGANVYDSGWVAGAGLSHDTTYAVTNGTKYHVSVGVRCSLTLESAESTKNITRVRWGRASYFFDGTSTPTSLFVENSQTVAANEILVLEYATTGSTTEPTTWYANIASAGLNRYFWHRVTMWGFASATPSSPDLNSLTWSYSVLALSLDRWTLASGGVVDTGTYVYGTQSLRHACNGAAQRTYQIVNVLPNKEIVLSGRMKVSGNPAAKLRIMSDDGTVELAAISAPTATTDWARYTTPAIDTGSESQVRVECYTSAAGGNTAWFDALKLEESAVATPWTPGFVSGAVTVDAGGLGIDASRGGVMRFRGSGGDAADVVELGIHGLKFSGQGHLAGMGTVFPTTNLTVNDLFFRTDKGMWYKWDTARWNCACPHVATTHADPVLPASATFAAHLQLVPALSMSDVNIKEIHTSYYVDGGTALSGSHKWVGVGSGFSINPTVTIASGASSVWRLDSQDISQLGGTGESSSYQFGMTWTKTGTPGPLYVLSSIYYFFVAT